MLPTTEEEIDHVTEYMVSQAPEDVAVFVPHLLRNPHHNPRCPWQMAYHRARV